MPTYSYRCRDCEVAFDIQQSFDEDSLTVCPECDGALRKVFNTVGVVFKGSGFYRTDSRAGAGASAGAASGSSSDKGSGGSSSSDGGSGSGSSGSGSGSSTSGSAGAASTSSASTAGSSS